MYLVRVRVSYQEGGTSWWLRGWCPLQAATWRQKTAAGICLHLILLAVDWLAQVVEVSQSLIRLLLLSVGWLGLVVDLALVVRSWIRCCSQAHQDRFIREVGVSIGIKMLLGHTCVVL